MKLSIITTMLLFFSTWTLFAETASSRKTGDTTGDIAIEKKIEAPRELKTKDLINFTGEVKAGYSFSFNTTEPGSGHMGRITGLNSGMGPMIPLKVQVMFGVSIPYLKDNRIAATHMFRSSLMYSGMTPVSKGGGESNIEEGVKNDILPANILMSIPLVLVCDYGLTIPYLDSSSMLFKGTGFKLNNSLMFSTGMAQFRGSAGFSPISFYSFSAGFAYGINWNDRVKGQSDEEDTSAIETPYHTFDFFINNKFTFDLSGILSQNKYSRRAGLRVNASTSLTYKSYIFSEYSTLTWSPDMDGTTGGWFINGDFSLGYRIPIYGEEPTDQTDPSLTTKEKLISRLTEKKFSIEPGFQLKILDYNLTHCLDSTMASGGYGSDFVYTAFGPYLNFQLPYNIFINTGFTFSNAPSYTEDYDEISDSLLDAEYENWYINMQGISLSVGWKF